PASVLAGVAGTTPTSGFGPHYGAEPSSGVQPGFVGRLEIIPVGFASDAGPPRIVSTAATSAECGVPYRYSEKGGPELSLDAGTFTFGAQGKGGAPLPEGFAIDTRTGEIRWVPSREQAGAHELEVWATHAAGSDVQRFSVTVSCPPQTETEVKCGCGHVGAGFSFLALTLVALTRRRWSR
ncbi:MAG: putative Ig domain-containing protein, partial [Myxococcota bacterium]